MCYYSEVHLKRGLSAHWVTVTTAAYLLLDIMREIILHVSIVSISWLQCKLKSANTWQVFHINKLWCSILSRLRCKWLNWCLIAHLMVLLCRHRLMFVLIKHIWILILTWSSKAKWVLHWRRAEILLSFEAWICKSVSSLFID